MIHFNSWLIESAGIFGRAANLLVPEVYIATSIKDFLDDRDSGILKPTNKLLPRISDFRGLSVIGFKNPTRFYNNEAEPYLSDMNSHLDIELKKSKDSSIGPLYLPADKYDELKRRRIMGLNQAIVSFDHSDGHSYLINYYEHGPASPERSEEGRESFMNLINRKFAG